MVQLHEIPNFKNFLKGLEQLKAKQLLAKESNEPFQALDNQVDHFENGVITPKGKGYLIDGQGELSFIKLKDFEDSKTYPPFSLPEKMLEEKNDFNIDYGVASRYYNLNKELAMKENELMLASNDFAPENPIELIINKETEDVQVLLEEEGVDPSTNDELMGLLEQHFSKIETLLLDFSKHFEEASVKDIPKIEDSLKGKVRELFKNFKDDLKELFVQMKHRVNSKIKSTTNDIKLNIHNAIAEQAQSVNNKMKHLTAAIDKKYQIIDKPESSDKLQTAVLETEERSEHEGQHLDTKVDQTLKEQSTSTLESINSRSTKLEDSIHAVPSNSIENNQNGNNEELLLKKVKQLKNENDGLKTFVNLVKSQHPSVYKDIYNTLKGVPQEIKGKKALSEVKEKEVELEL